MLDKDAIIQMMARFVVYNTCMTQEKARAKARGIRVANPGRIIQQDAYVQGVLEACATILNFLDRKFTVDDFAQQIEQCKAQDPIGWAKMQGNAEAFVKGNIGPEIVH